MHVLVFIDFRETALAHDVFFAVKVVPGVERDFVEDALEFIQRCSLSACFLELSDDVEKYVMLGIDARDSDVVLCLPEKHRRSSFTMRLAGKNSALRATIQRA